MDRARAWWIASVAIVLAGACGGGNAELRKPRIVSSAPVPGSATTSAKVVTTRDGAVITVRTEQTCAIVRETPFTSGGWIRRKQRRRCHNRALANAAMLFRVGSIEIALGRTNDRGEVSLRWATLRPKLAGQQERFGKVLVARTSEEVATLGIASQRQSATELAWRRAVQAPTTRNWLAFIEQFPTMKTEQAKQRLLRALIHESDIAVRTHAKHDAPALSAIWASQFSDHARTASYQRRLTSVGANSERPALTKLVTAAVARAQRLGPGFAQALINARAEVAWRAKHGVAWAPRLLATLDAATRTAARRAAAQGRLLRRKRKFGAAYQLLSAASFLAPSDRHVKRELTRVTPLLRGVTVGFVNVLVQRVATGVQPRLTWSMYVPRRVKPGTLAALLSCGSLGAALNHAPLAPGTASHRWTMPTNTRSPGTCTASASIKRAGGVAPVELGRWCGKPGGPFGQNECR